MRWIIIFGVVFGMIGLVNADTAAKNTLDELGRAGNAKLYLDRDKVQVSDPATPATLAL